MSDIDLFGPSVTTPPIDQTRDKTVRPQDDLYGHVNGAWLTSFEMPDDRAADGAFRELFDIAEEYVHDIVNWCERMVSKLRGGPTIALVGNMFASFMDDMRCQDLGSAPLNPDLDLIESATTHAELAAAIGRLERTGVGGLAASWVDTDPGDPNRYAVNIAQAGIGLPDEAYYREESFAEVREAYRKHIKKMLDLVWPKGRDPLPDNAAARIWDVEEKLAATHWDVVESRDETKTFNPMTLADLVERAPGFDWQAWAEAVQVPKRIWGRLVVRQPSFAEEGSQVWANTGLEDLKCWAAWRVIQARAGLLSEEIAKADFQFWGPVITGATSLRERWKRGVSLVESTFGEIVGEIYVSTYFPPSSKTEVSAIVHHLLEAYRASISQLEWMGPKTREKALAKLEKFTAKIGYPDKWRRYEGLELDEKDLVGNVRAAAAFETDYELAKACGPVDRGEWFMTPQTVNAYYNPGMNEIVFPAAILQPPFYTAGGDPAANYGGIGAVIGHEIGHGFDDQGSKYDGDGRLADWWTEEDRAEFDRRTAALIAQYNAYVPRQLAKQDNAPHVNGDLTIGENIGDLGGLAIAWLAYTMSGEPTDDDAARRFFEGWAASWRTMVRDEEEVRRLTTDPHSPAEFRCNGVVRNLDIFHRAYGVKEGDELWLAPRERVSIW
ncbi:MAG: peptidase M13 [Micrococcales bacterium]|nr:peptidase M13 [Micrococcales bacterium]